MTLSKKPIVVKFGGSAITFKDRSPPEVNRSVVKQASKELALARAPILLVLGGGAHGHQAAHSFGYGNPITPRNTLLEGISHIRHNMSVLSLEIESILGHEGINTVVLSPFSFVTMNEGKVKEFPTTTIRKCIESGISVVLHGDVCFDEKSGASILSGDTIVALVAKIFDAQSVFLGTNVDGLYDKDPSINPDASLITELTLSKKKETSFQIGTSRTTDVTGGMTRKISDLSLLSNIKAEIAIFNLTIPGRLQALLQGQPTICTKVRF